MTRLFHSAADRPFRSERINDSCAGENKKFLIDARGLRRLADVVAMSPLPKLPLRDEFAQIAVCRRHHSHVKIDDLRSAEQPMPSLLERAQKFWLQTHRQLRDFVEEQSAAMSQFHQPRFRMNRR